MIDYKPKESFFKKYSRTHQEALAVVPKKDERAEIFEEELRKDVDLSKFSRPVTEIGENSRQATTDRTVESKIEEKE